MFDQPASIERSPYATYGQAIRPQYTPATYAPQQYGFPKPPSVWDTYRSALMPPSAPITPVESAVTGMRHLGEGAAMSALLALIQKHFGLDVGPGRKYPVDAILGAVLFGLSIKEADKPGGYASDLRALAQANSDVFVYRKILGDANAHSSKNTSAAPAVSTHGDPILEAARQAGF